MNRLFVIPSCRRLACGYGGTKGPNKVRESDIEFFFSPQDVTS